MFFSALPPRKSRYYLKIRKILTEEGDEAATQYFKSLTQKQKEILMNDAINLLMDKESQIAIATMLKEIEDTVITLGFSDQ